MGRVPCHLREDPSRYMSINYCRRLELLHQYSIDGVPSEKTGATFSFEVNVSTRQTSSKPQAPESETLAR
jgi:hypothetical protein